MTSEDLKLNKITELGTKYSSGNISDVKNVEEKAVENIFNAFKNFAKNHGVTINSEYLKVIVDSHPEILNLPEKKQTETIINLLTRKEPTQSDEQSQMQQQPVFALTEEEQKKLLSSLDIPSTNEFNVAEEINNKSETNFFESLKTSDSEYTTTVNSQYEREELLKKESCTGQSYDLCKFNKLSETEQIAEYKKEYAKNRYLYEDDEKRDIQSWIALGKAGQQKIIDKYSKEADLILKNFDIQTQNAFELSDNRNSQKQSKYQILMLQLQTANHTYENITNFREKDNINQFFLLAEMLESKSINNIPMTQGEKYFYEKACFIKDAMNEYANKYKLGISEICFSEISSFASSNEKTNKRIPIGTAIKEKLINTKNRTAAQEELLKFLNSVEDEYLISFGLNYGTDSVLTKEIKADEKYQKEYLNAKTDRERAAIKVKYFYEKYKDSPEFGEKLHEYAESSIMTADINELYAFYNFATHNEEFAKAIGDALGDIAVVTASQVDKLGNKGFENYANNLKTLDASDAKKAKNLSNRALKTATEEQKSASGIFTTFSTFSLYKKEGSKEFAENFLYGINNPETAKKIANEIKTTGTQEQKNEFASNANIAGGKAQVVLIEVLTDGDKIATNAVIEARTLTKLHQNNQTKTFSLLQKRCESLMSKNDAIKNLKTLTDQIPQCNAENQASMHGSIVNGKYEEVAVYASSNIYKYEQSAQAEALAISYATGNPKIIEAATLQTPKMAEVATNAMKDQIATQIRAIEEKYAQTLINEYASHQLKKANYTDTLKPEYKTRLEAYIAEMKSLPRTEMYRRIAVDMKHWPTAIQTLFLEAIVKYCPQLFSIMLDKYGINLLYSFGQINITTKNEILTKMLKTPSKRSEAMAYIKSNPNGNYSDNLKILYDEIMDDLISGGQIAVDTTTKGLSTSRTLSTNPNSQRDSSLTALAQKYNWKMDQDINGNIRLLS